MQETYHSGERQGAFPPSACFLLKSTLAMAEPVDNAPAALDQDQQLRDAVVFFEQMLQTMPDDRISLEVLAQAYEQAGDGSRACELLVRLAEVIAREGDREAAKPLCVRLSAFAGAAAVDAALDKLSRFLASSSAASASDVPSPDRVAADAMRLISGPVERRALIAQELDFAWMLHQENLLSEDQYASIVGDLTDLSASPTPAPVSVLHLFQDRQFSNIDRVIAFAAEKSGTPVIPLASFEPQPAAFKVLPLDYLIIKGVLPFESMATDLLVGVLNPLSEPLRRELGALTGRRCHFFLVHPAGFDAVLEKIRNA